MTRRKESPTRGVGGGPRRRRPRSDNRIELTPRSKLHSRTKAVSSRGHERKPGAVEDPLRRTGMDATEAHGSILKPQSRGRVCLTHPLEPSKFNGLAYTGDDVATKGGSRICRK